MPAGSSKGERELDVQGGARGAGVRYRTEEATAAALDVKAGRTGVSDNREQGLEGAWDLSRWSRPPTLIS